MTTNKNTLTTSHPELAAQWHPTKNGDLTPEMLSADSNKKVWWLMPYNDEKTGKHFDFEWEATVASRAKNQKCPFLCERAVYPGFNDHV